jgi:hypothetical protein
MNRFLVLMTGVLALAALPAAAQHGSATHGDHNAHHGGVVEMWGTLHYEVVTPPAGNVMVYFTDEQRNDLPASAVQRLRAEIVRPDRSVEPLAMAISANGDHWMARSKPVTSAKTVIRLAFVHRGEQATVEIYGDMIPRLAKAAPKPAPKAAAKARPAAAKPKPVDPHAGH